MLESVILVEGHTTGDRPRRLGGSDVERGWRALRSMRRSRSYPVLGMALALGAPVGLLGARALAAGRAPSPAWVWAELRHLPETYAYVTLATVVAFGVLGLALGRAFERVHLLSITDPLTGLFNRRHFRQRMVEELGRGRRHGHVACILCIDVDHLKEINDGLGHGAGDRALLEVSRIVSKNVRVIDPVARVGGDEFAVLLPETSATQAMALSQRILVETAQHSDPSIGRLAVSIGIAELNDEVDLEDVLVAADAALYRVKAAGGGQAAIGRLGSAAPPSRHVTLRESWMPIDHARRSVETTGSGP